MAMEMRWFFPGTVPEEVSRWFKDGLLGTGPDKYPEVPDPKGKRADAYLATRDDDIGVKMRNTGVEPKLEFKWRLATEEFASSGGLVTGTLENWDKKSWKLTDKQQE